MHKYLYIYNIRKVKNLRERGGGYLLYMSV